MHFFLAPTQAPISLAAPTVPPSHGRKFHCVVVFYFYLHLLCLQLLLIYSSVDELKVSSNKKGIIRIG